MTSVPPSYQHPGAPPARPELPEGIERPPESPARRREPTAVPIWATLLPMIAAVVAAGIAFALLAALAGAKSEADAPQSVVLAATLVQDLVLVLAAFVAVRVFEKAVSPAWFGLRRVPLWPAVGAAVVMYVAWWLFQVLVLVALGQPEEQELVSDLKAESSDLVLAGFAVVVCVFAPICEELFFRGFLFRVLSARLGVAAGALLSGAVFGLAHLPGSPIQTGISLFALGVGFALLRWWTGSLIPSMTLHAVNNALSFGVTLTLDWWIFMLVVAGSTALVLAISLWMANSTWGRLNA